MSKKQIHSLAIGTFISAFIIVLLSKFINTYSIWVAFAGCTSFFISLSELDRYSKKQLLIKSIGSNIVGVFIGVAIIAIGSHNILLSAFITAFFSAIIVYLGSYLPTKYSSTLLFIGGISAFALGPVIPVLLFSLFIGNILGILADKIAIYYMNTDFSKKEY